MQTFRYLLAAGMSTALVLSPLKPGVSQTISSTPQIDRSPVTPSLFPHQDRSGIWPTKLPVHQETLAPSSPARQAFIEIAPSPPPLVQFSQREAISFKQVLPTPTQENRNPAPIAASLRSQLAASTLAPSDKPLTPTPTAQANEAIDLQIESKPIEQPIEPEALPPSSTSAVDLVPKVDKPAPESLNPDSNPLLFPTQPDEVKIRGTQPITLQQALELAKRNSETLQVVRLERDRSRAALREAQAAWYPTLTLNSNITRQQTASGGLQARRVGAGGGAFATIFTTGGSGFDTPSSAFSTTLEATYDIYTAGNRSASVRLAEKQLRSAELEVEEISEQLRLNITTAYYDLQEADENIRIAKADVENAEKSLDDAEALERAGLGTRFDVLQAEVELANSQQTLTQNISQQSIARRNMARLLNLPQSLDISAADPVEKASDWLLSLEQSIVLALKNRAELEQLLLERESSRHRRRIALSQIGPQIDIFANYEVLDVFEDEENFADGYTIGVRFNWNFFDGGAAQARANQEQKNQEIAERNFEQQRNTVRFEVEQAYYDLQFNAKNIGTATKALEQAKEALRLARLRFQAGVGIQLDVLDAQAELTRAEGNLVSAILGYNRALASIQRAISNLPDSDLSNRP